MSLAAITWSNCFLYNYQPLTLLWTSLTDASLQGCFIEVRGREFTLSSLKVWPQHFNQDESWTFTEPLEHFESFLLHLFCWRFAGVLGLTAHGWLNDCRASRSCGCKTSLCSHAWQFLWGVCADVLCLVFTKCATWIMAKGHCSTSLEVCSDATLQFLARLSHSF